MHTHTKVLLFCSCSGLIFFLKNIVLRIFVLLALNIICLVVILVQIYQCVLYVREMAEKVLSKRQLVSGHTNLF